MYVIETLINLRVAVSSGLNVFCNRLVAPRLIDVVSESVVEEIEIDHSLLIKIAQVLKRTEYQVIEVVARVYWSGHQLFFYSFMEFRLHNVIGLYQEVGVSVSFIHKGEKVAFDKREQASGACTK